MRDYHWRDREEEDRRILIFTARWKRKRHGSLFYYYCLKELKRKKRKKQQPSVSYASIYTLDFSADRFLQISTSMADPSPQSPTPSPALQSPTSEPPPPPPPCSVFPSLKGLKRPKLRVTSEFDSDSLLFFNKVSCKIFDNLAKLKLSFHNNAQREVSQPQVSFTSKYVSVLYDVEEKNAFVKSTVDVSPRLQLRALHNVKVRLY